jgi:transcriptional regulator with GAF, ATPase, and Fis domain
VSSVHRVADLQRRLLESILEAVPAGRAAILLGGESTAELTSALHWTRSGGEARAFRIPRRVIQSVLDDRTAVRINDALSVSSKPSPTIVEANISALMAVAIVAPGENAATIGALYVDASDPGVRFGEDDLHLLLAVADVSALPLANALRTERLEKDNERLISQLAGDRPLLGASERMRAVHRFIAKVARSDATVLIAGASGTGKELVARAIHRSSARGNKPFVAINCAAVAESLLESEFFGHEKGAFTSAYAQKKGKLEEANGGTIFLDEIGELALPLQAKLLRVLQEREFERVGGSSARPIKVNIRVIAATNRDLQQEIKRGAFRQDLFFRLNVVSLTVPALSERREDIPRLALHFLEKHARACGSRVTNISADALVCLTNYDWPGNVRELENAIERAIVLGTTEQIIPEDLPDSIVESGIGSSTSSAKFHETIKDFKRQLVTSAFDQSHGSHTEAARRLGLHPNNLHRLMKTLGLK